MEVEFWRGPLDGTTQAIPDDARLWIVRSPRVLTRRGAEPVDAPPPTADIEYNEYAYVWTERFGITSKARCFDYIGERAKP